MRPACDRRLVALLCLAVLLTLTITADQARKKVQF